MPTIRITKEFHFEMAHALLGYDGLCSSIHGHSYKLSITITGSPVNDQSILKNGMIMDFEELKTIVEKEIICHFDHAIVLNSATPEKEKISSMFLFKRAIFLPYQPTCENLLNDFAERIKKNLPDGLKLYRLKLRETENSYAEWFAEDNVE